MNLTPILGNATNITGRFRHYLSWWKESTTVKFVEVTTDDRVIASAGSFDSPEQQRDLCLLPTNILNFMSVEVSRMLKLGGDAVRAVRWRVPRQRKEYFQDDLFKPIRDTRYPLCQIVDWDARNIGQFPLFDFLPKERRDEVKVLLVKVKQKLISMRNYISQRKAGLPLKMF
jgi:coronin-7